MDASTADHSLSHLLLPGNATPSNGVDPFGWGAQDLPEFEFPEGMEAFSPTDLPLWLQVSFSSSSVRLRRARLVSLTLPSRSSSIF